MMSENQEAESRLGNGTDMVTEVNRSPQRFAHDLGEALAFFPTSSASKVPARYVQNTSVIVSRKCVTFELSGHSETREQGLAWICLTSS